jgi:hypothetical protein
LEAQVENKSDTATPAEVALALDTSEQALAQQRYRGRGPRFVKNGSRVLYRWADVNAYLDANIHQQTGAMGA